jgi:hypothetical protein
MCVYFEFYSTNFLVHPSALLRLLCSFTDSVNYLVTTVAKILYNQLYGDFDASCIVFNVYVIAVDTTGLTNFQKQILKDLTKYDEKVDCVDQGKSLFEDHFGGKCVLISDDVGAVIQLDALVGDWLGLGSRVIIISRGKHILNVALVSSYVPPSFQVGGTCFVDRFL